MAAEEQQVDFDLDEDLFQFDEIRDESGFATDDADLDEIFASFNDREFDPPPGFDEEINISSVIDAEEDAAGDTPELVPAPIQDATQNVPPIQAAPSAAAPTPEQRAQAPIPSVLAPESTTPPTPQAQQPGAIGSVVNAIGGVTKLKVSPAILLILAAITATNGLVAIVAMKATSENNETIREFGQEIKDLSKETYQLASETHSTAQQIADPDNIGINLDDIPLFKEIEEDIAKRDYRSAKMRLHARLAILDRTPPARRAETESQARYLLGKIRYELAKEAMMKEAQQ